MQNKRGTDVDTRAPDLTTRQHQHILISTCLAATTTAYATSSRLVLPLLTLRSQLQPPPPLLNNQCTTIGPVAAVSHMEKLKRSLLMTGSKASIKRNHEKHFFLLCILPLLLLPLLPVYACRWCCLFMQPLCLTAIVGS